jgi:hypothetical protein
MAKPRRGGPVSETRSLRISLPEPASHASTDEVFGRDRCWLKAWAMKIARQRGIKKAIVALARRLAVIMHRIWVDGTEFRWTREQVAAAA